MAGMEAKFSQNPPQKFQKLSFVSQIGLRILTSATTLVAALLTVTNKEAIEVFPGITQEAKYNYDNSYKFLAIANFLACGLSLLSLLAVIFAGRPGSNPTNYYFLFIHDLLMLSLEIAACGAATAIGLAIKYGNEHLGWTAVVCVYAKTFCDRAMTALAFGYLSMLLLLVLTVTSANRSRQIQV